MQDLLPYSSDADQELYMQRDDVRVRAATVAGSPEKPNEDAFAAAAEDGRSLAAVFDGSTSLKPIKALGKQTGARFASHFLKDNFSLESPGRAPRELMLALNERLLQKSLSFAGVTLDDIHTLPASTGTIIALDVDTRELSFAHVGDSFGIVYYEGGHSEVFTDDKNSRFDEKIFDLMREIVREKGISLREARQDERVKQALIDMYMERNNNPRGTGCGMMNGDPQIAGYIQSGQLSLEGATAVLLGSDGLPPQGWYVQEEADRQKLLKEVIGGGFQRVFALKHASEAADPDWNHIRYKQSDDATGVLLLFE